MTSRDARRVWSPARKNDADCRRLADRHYTQQTPGSPHWTRPGYNYVLKAPGAVFVWWRPKWEDGRLGTSRKDGMRVLECALFRRESGPLASIMICAARAALLWSEAAQDLHYDCMGDVRWLITGVGSRHTAARRSARRLGAVRKNGQARGRVAAPARATDDRSDLMIDWYGFRKKLDRAFTSNTCLGSFDTSNPARGHCAAVTLLLVEEFGATPVSTRVDGQSHWLARLDDCDVDLTGDQFGRPAVQVGPAGSLWENTRERSLHDVTPETWLRAMHLRRRMG